MIEPASAIRTEPEIAAPDAPARHSVHLGLFGRTPPFTSRQRRVFTIATTAGFFDQYDRALLSIALKQIQAGLKIAESQIGTMLAVIRIGYILSLLLTPLADVFGRRRLLLYTVVGYTIFTGLSAIAPGEKTFVLYQILARAFAGAEAAVALVILAEEVDAAHRGWAIGLLGGISSAGYGLAAIVFAFINVMPYGWRGLYAIALVPLALLIPLRRVLPESARFEKEQSEGTGSVKVWEPLVQLYSAYPKRLLMMLSVMFLASMGGNAAGFLFPKFLQEAHGWTPGNVSSLFLFGGALSVMGSIVAGRLSDRLGRRVMGTTFLFVAPLLTIWMYTAPGFTIVPVWILEVFFDIAAGTIMSAYSAEMFPTSYRSTAGSALAVAGTTGGAIGLFLEGVLFNFTGSHARSVCYLTVFWLIAPAIMWFFPETSGRELEEISPETGHHAAL
ncbi:MAG: MFS transporter [Candidatus Binatus sp.]|uniref:MFS transporter n=1 Tax=Candidatus Binatus sp. TaxID=2811406 RepID=UPI0027288BD5|nr:MFS transporter [Candidatus Binatus sp.]MDO8431490.1 MFS transporter [Candidatus Binatus sp.]